MKTNMKLDSIAALCFLAIVIPLGACRSPYDGYGSSLYRQLKKPTPENQAAHLNLLAKVIERADRNQVRPPPGVCAEYGYNLGLLGRTAEATDYLDREVQHYPESETFVSVLKRIVSGRGRILSDQEHSSDSSNDLDRGADR